MKTFAARTTAFALMALAVLFVTAPRAFASPKSNVRLQVTAPVGTRVQTVILRSPSIALVMQAVQTRLAAQVRMSQSPIVQASAVEFQATLATIAALRADYATLLELQNEAADRAVRYHSAAVDDLYTFNLDHIRESIGVLEISELNILTRPEMWASISASEQQTILDSMRAVTLEPILITHDGRLAAETHGLRGVVQFAQFGVGETNPSISRLTGTVTITNGETQIPVTYTRSGRREIESWERQTYLGQTVRGMRGLQCSSLFGG